MLRFVDNALRAVDAGQGPSLHTINEVEAREPWTTKGTLNDGQFLVS